MRKLLVVLALVGATLGFGFMKTPVALAAANGCDASAIMRCGSSSPRDFITKATQNKPGDLRAVYADYGLAPSEYTRFVTDAKPGTLYNDGRIVVDGRVAGHSTLNVGRVHDSNFSQKVNIGGHTYWGGSFGSTFRASSAAVMVLFDNKGVMQFAVIDNCGNPQRISALKPGYSCDKLQKSSVQGSDNTYSFTTAASATNGAKLVKAIYNFGDGTTQTVTDLRQPVRHTFTKDSHVSVRVFVDFPGGNNAVTPISTDCATDIVFKAPPTPPAPQQPLAQCTSVDTPVLSDSASRKYTFTAHANYSGGAVFKGASVNFGDGVTAQNVIPDSDAKQVIVSHAYNSSGNYTVIFTLHFTGANGNQLADVNCQTQVSPVAPPVTPTPTCTDTSSDDTPISSGTGDFEDNADADSDTTSDVATGQASTAAATNCPPAQSLVNTGPGEIAAGLFAGVAAFAGVGNFVIRRRLGL